MNDLVLIATASAAVTAAALITLWAAHARTYRRTLARVRARRDAYRAEVRQLREERRDARWAEHVADATRVTVDEPIDYTVVDAAAYRPVWTNDNTAVTEYVQLRDASRRARGVTR